MTKKETCISQFMDSIKLLEKLISFPTVSCDSNLELIEFVQNHLAELNIDSELIYDEHKNKANLYATVGPKNVSGIMLSGHTDVVPVTGQKWSTNPFVMERLDDKLFGRGTADMKGFIACVLSLLNRIDPVNLETPIHIALSFDEEIGCIGVRRLIDSLAQAPLRPKYCIIGEPTSMKLKVAHKGKTAAKVSCHGKECHSSLAPSGLNAIYLANDMISALRRIQNDIKANGIQDSAYDVAYTTLHVGVIGGGTALNIVPNLCHFDFEIRHLPEDSPDELLAKIELEADQIVERERHTHPEAAITIEVTNSYPALSTDTDSDIVKLIQSLGYADSFGKITFGTEGGLFSNLLGIQTVVLGPGNIEQAHKPNEFVEIEQLRRCDEFLNQLVNAISK